MSNYTCMTRRKTPSWLYVLHEHITAFVIAGIVVVGIAGTIMFRDGLLADITAANTGEKNESTTLPIVYSIQDGKLEVKTSATFTKVTSMTFFVVFDPKSVVLDLAQATSPYSFTFAPGMDSMIQVTVVVHGDVAAGSTVFTLPMSGSIDNVTIANAGVLRDDDTFETVAIQKK